MMIRRRDIPKASTGSGGPTHAHSSTATWRRRMRPLTMRSRSQQARIVYVCVVFGLVIFSVKTLLVGNLGSPSSRRARIPNLLVAGAQKAGTTSIFAYLEGRSDVCISRRAHPGQSNRKIKEVHFFDGGSNYEQGIEYYRDRFRHCSEEYAIVVDGSPKTVEHPDRVYETYRDHGTLGDLRVLIVLREPVSRELSEYNMRVRNMMKPKNTIYREDIVKEDGSFYTFEEYAERKSIPRILNYTGDHGLYGKYLKGWFELFNRKQILVLSFDELLTNQTAFLERIHLFLDLPMERRMTLPTTNSQHGDWWKEVIPSCAIQDKLAPLYERSNAEAFALLDKYPGPDMEQRPFPRYQYHCKEKR